MFSEYSLGIHSIQWRNKAVWLVVQPWGELVVGKLGAQVLHYQPKDQQAVFWLNESCVGHADADLKAARGGVPICWPWFGAHLKDKDAPNHGYARNALWQLSKQDLSEDVTNLKFSPQKALADELAVHLELSISDESLKMCLVTKNHSDQSQFLTQALHSYFNVGDYRDLKIDELDGLEYIDKLDDFVTKQQQGVFVANAEVDRIYKHRHQLSIKDPLLKRQIVIEKKGSGSTVVWHPASSYREYGIGEHWSGFICVEAANTEYEQITLAAKQSCELQQSIKILPFSEV